MPLLQPRLNLKVAQRQVLTPGLMQMVSVLALNKLELKEMIDAEMVENPVLEEIDETVPMLDEVGGRIERQERQERMEQLDNRATEAPSTTSDSFNEVDFGSYFQDYLDPGYRTQPEYEENERPSFENFLSQPTTLGDHLAWQLGASTVDPQLEKVAEFIIGNLDEDGYLAINEEELVEALRQFQSSPEIDDSSALDLVRRAIELVQRLDPPGVAARDLRECLLIQIAAQQEEFAQVYARRLEEDEPEDGQGTASAAAEAKLEERKRSMEIAALIADRHLNLVQKRDVKDLSKALQVTPVEAQAAVEFIRTLDPRPGRLYNREQTRLIEPDVVFTKRGGEWVVSMNEEDLPSLRLSQRYRRMLVAQGTDKEVKEYVKERFRSALQLMRNIAQRKSTILRTCEVIVRRQQDFLDKGIEALRPMMIKEVAEEIGVHPSTVSRAVANKYAHTPQGVIELRFFFSEGSNGPEGADTPLLVLKRKVRKLIEDEDARHPLTDDQLAAMLQAQGIQLTRRTVAKYREDMNIPSTHQRRRRDS
ncbi:MAG TPA: RNA polymerase sigma-54 factor [Terracidiphilus sp.]|jgi:RNA polymerase sigma-54 factor|nr:RNA polymerase sigma-54 factor [Terracidiphilus sp.]